jgi:predicted TIM-barrel enzyme
MGFIAGQTIAIESENAVVVAVTGGRGGATITVAPLTLAHAAGAQVSGSGITLTSALTKAHASGSLVTTSLPTPGAPNRYYARSH